MTISIETLGPVAVTIDGKAPPPELLWRKNLALVVYLARSPNGTRTRDHLIGLLWAEKTESAARHSLREAIRVIRKTVGEDHLTTEHDQVRLSPGAVELDVDTLAVCVDANEWEKAAALIRGEFLEGFSVPDATSFEDWLIADRASWRRQSAEALGHWSHTLMERGQTQPALTVAERTLELEPSFEHALHLAMRAASLSGDRAGALQRYEEHRARLADLGTEPSLEAAALADRIRQERSWQLAEAVPSATTEGAELRRAPLVGRDTELATLLEAWRACSDHRTAHAVVIDAASGLGKTRLAEELFARTRLDGATVATIRAVESDYSNPWNGCLGLARGGLCDAPGISAAAPESLGAFGAHLPEWADRFGIATSDRSMATALGDVVGAVLEEGPVALFVDDAHWIDRDSLLALLALLRDHSDRPLLVTFAIDTAHQRPELDDLRARLGRDTPGVTVRLGPLPADALYQLTSWAVPSYAPEDVDRLARRVATDSAGLPLLAVELLHAVALGMDLGTIQGAWPEPFKTLDQTLPGDLPDGVVAAIRVGYRRLSDPAQRTMAAIAVLGEPVLENRVAAATGLEGSDLHAALDELEWQRWVVADSRGYSCVAAIVRDIIARDMVTSGQRERMKTGGKAGRREVS